MPISIKAIPNQVGILKSSRSKMHDELHYDAGIVLIESIAIFIRARLLAVVCIVLALSKSFLPAAEGEVLHVPGTYATISAAIVAAHDGATIEVEPGFYLESSPYRLNPDTKKIRIRPASGKAILAAAYSAPNDEYGHGIELSGTNISIRAHNYGASDGVEEFDLEPHPRPGEFLGEFGAGVWYEWTAPTNTATMITASSDEFPVSLDVFREFFQFKPRPVTNELAWPLEYPNEVGFYPFAGSRYHILVGGRGPLRGQFELSIHQDLPPFNDPFTNAMELSGNSVKIVGSTLFATAEPPLEPPHAGTDAAHSVWFTWTAPGGDAISPRPMRLNTEGDFTQILSVFRGSKLDQLNLDAEFMTGVGVFHPSPDEVYQFALDGLRSDERRSNRAGTYLLQLDHSVVDISTNWLTTDVLPIPMTENARGFEGQISVTNWGFAPTGPLRLRLVARRGSSSYAIHTASQASEMTLEDYSLNGGEGLSSAQITQHEINGFIPGPILYPNGFTKEFWGAFALLEEQFAGTDWITIDSLFLSYGFKGSLFRVNGLRPRTVPQTINSGELNQILGFDIQSVFSIANGVSNRFFLVALLDDGIGGLKERSVNAVSWQAPNWVGPNPDGTFDIQNVDYSTNITITAGYYLGGETRNVQDRLWVYRRPRLQIISAPGPSPFQYRIESDFGAHYFLESTDGLTRGENPDQWSWELHMDLGVLDQFPRLQNLDPIFVSNRFYRLRAEPLDSLQP